MSGTAARQTLPALALIFALALPAGVWAQGTVKQLGPVVPQHLSMYAGNGMVMDAGGGARSNLPPPNDVNPGTRPTGLAIVNSGLGVALYSGYANANYNELLFGFDPATGDGLVKLDRSGGGPLPVLYCEINGVRTPCFGGGGGTVSSVGAEHGLYATPSPVTGAGVIGCVTGAVGTLGCLQPDGTMIAVAVDGTIRLGDTTVEAGTYTYATVTIDPQGRTTAISSGDTPPTPIPPGDPDGSLQYNCAGFFCGATIAAGLDMTAGILSLTQILNDQSGGDYTILTEDGATTILLGAHSYALPQAGNAGFENKWGACLLNIGDGNATLSTTTSLFKGAGGGTSLTLRPGDWACPSSDGTDYPTLAGFNYLGLTAGLPVIGGGAGAQLSQGARSGTGTLYVTTTGAQTSGRCVEIDASGNHIAGAAGCGTGSGSVTQVDTGTGLTGGPITTTGTVALDDTAVTPGSYTYASLTVDQQGRLTAVSSGAAPPSAANPTATAGPAAVNGSAPTFMRSDAAPLVQKATAAQFGIVEVDGTTITASGGVISAVSGASGINQLTGDLTAGPGSGSQTGTLATVNADVGSFTYASITVNAKGLVTAASSGAAPAAGANPTATAGPVAVNGSASTYMRSDGAPAIQKATAAQFGIVEVDGSTITASGGVISAASGTTGINQLTGDVTAGPGVGSQAATLASTAVTPGSYTYASLTVDQQGRLTAASSGAAPAAAANPTATAGPAAVNGSASTFMRSDAAPLVQKATAAQFGIVEVDGTTITASGGVISAALPTVKGVAAIGWVATTNPDKIVVLTASSSMTITAARGTVDTAVGATATIQPYKTASGTPCSSGTALTTGTFDANGTAVTNQTLTLAGSGAPSMVAGDRICLSTGNGAAFTAGTGNGGITFEYTVP